MTNFDDYVVQVLTEFGTDEDVASAVQVAAAVSDSGINLTSNVELLLKLLRIPQLNFLLIAKVKELVFLFNDKFPEIQWTKLEQID